PETPWRGEQLHQVGAGRKSDRGVLAEASTPRSCVLRTPVDARTAPRPRLLLIAGDELSQHVLQDAAMAEVGHLLRCVDARANLEALLFVAGIARDHRQYRARAQGVVETFHVKRFESGDADAVAGRTIHELERQHAHPYQ